MKKLPAIIQKSSSALLNRTPRLKHIAKKLYIKYVWKKTGTDKYSALLQCAPETTDVYTRLLDFVVKKNSFNVRHTVNVNKLVLALMEKDHEYLELAVTKKSYPDLIVSCYLYMLRRYPLEKDIDLWTDLLDQGATIDNLLNVLKNSLEFQETGTYYLQEV